MKLIPTNEAINIVSFGLLAVQQTTAGVKKAVAVKLKQQQKDVTAQKVNAARLMDAEKKAEKEKIIEAKKPGANIGNAGLNRALSAGGGLFSRLVSALGAIVAGFVLDKLPQIIEEVMRIKRMVERIVKSITGVFDQFKETTQEMVDVARQLWDNIQNLDFLDSEGKLRRELNEAQSSLEKSRRTWDQSVSDIQKAIQDYASGKDKQQPDQPPDTTTGPTGPTPTGSNVALKKKIRQLESGNDYGATFRGYLKDFARKDEDITKMSIAEVVQYQKDYIAHQKRKGIPASKRSAAVGAYQMLYPEVAAQAVGIPLSAKFDRATQDKLAEYYLDIAGQQDYLKGKISAEQYNNRLAGQFASIKKTTGRGAYDDDGINKAYGTVLEEIKQSAPPPAKPPAPKPTPPKVEPQTPKAGNVVDTGYRDYQGRPVRLKAPAATAFKEMAAAAKKDGIDLGPGVSSSYRDKEDNTRVGGAEGSMHMEGMAIDINWNTPAGKWIRENAHKYGWKHNDYSGKSTHFDYTGEKSTQRPYSTTLASANTGTKLDADQLKPADESPLTIPIPINTIAKVESSSPPSGSSEAPSFEATSNTDLIATLYSLNTAYT